MKVLVDGAMIGQAITNVNNKLSEGSQVERVYSKTPRENQYYLNNLIGELGELVFAKAVADEGRVLGPEPNDFGFFMNSDICDFYTSKTEETIDVKTVHGTGAGNLIVTKSIADWRPVYVYVLVRLNNHIKNIEDFHNVQDAHIVGSMTDGSVRKQRNVREINGRDVYFVKTRRLTEIEKLIESHFLEANEKTERYYPTGEIVLDVASLESGSVDGDSNVNGLAKYYKSKKANGKYNHMLLKTEKGFVTFSIHHGIFYPSLFIKSLLKASKSARRHNKTLVLPPYIGDYVEDDKDIMNMIDNLRCEVRYIWSRNKYY